MATEAARLELKESTGRKKKNRLDTHRPSHGRHLNVPRVQKFVHNHPGMKRRTEMHPVSGLNDRQELLAFFDGEYREVQRLVRCLRVRGTENSYNSHTPFVAAERECTSNISGCDPLPEAQNVMPAAVAYALEEFG